MATTCDYGCGNEATFYFEKAKKHCCSDHYRKCPHQAKLIGEKRRGKKHSEESKALIGKATKERINRDGHPNTGKKLSDERKAHQSAKMKGRPSWAKGLTAETDERVRKLQEHKQTHPEKYANCGEANGMYGKKHTSEVKQLLRERNIAIGKWRGEDNFWFGEDRSGEKSPRYLSNVVRRSWQTYKGQARYWTEKEYQQHNDVINPTNLPRGIRQYHIDHIIPLWYGFINGIHPKLLSKKENLRMLWHTDNLKRSKVILDESAQELLKVLIK